MIYQPRELDSICDDFAAIEELATWIENHFSGKWIRFYNEPVKLIRVLAPAHEDPISAIRFKHSAEAEIRRWNGDYRSVSVDHLQALAEDDFLVCPVCEGDGEVTPLNNPTGQRCPDCFGTGRFLHELK